MDVVADILDVEQTVRTEPVTLAELRADRPQAALLVRAALAHRCPPVEAARRVVVMPSSGDCGVLDASSWNPSRS